MVSFITKGGTHGESAQIQLTSPYLIFHAPGIHQCQVKADFFKLGMDVPI